MKEDVWTNIARSYDEILTNWSLYGQIVERVVGHLDDAQVICDQGCGTGIISMALVENGSRVFGVDNNPFMLARAIKKVTPDLEGRVSFQEGDALDLKFADESFDGVVSNNVIFYVSDPERLLEQAYRVLRPGKKFVIIGPRPDPDIEKLAAHVHDEFEQNGVLDAFQEHYDNFMGLNREMKREGMLSNTYDAATLAGMCREVGFREVAEASEDLYLGVNYLVAMRK